MTATQNADKLLSNWVSILSQTHHTQNLLFDNENWSGLTDDIQQQEHEAALEEERRHEQELLEQREEEERERERLRRELEREQREKDNAERQKIDEARKLREEKERKRREALYGYRKPPPLRVQSPAASTVAASSRSVQKGNGTLLESTRRGVGQHDSLANQRNGGTINKSRTAIRASYGNGDSSSKNNDTNDSRDLDSSLKKNESQLSRASSRFKPRPSRIPTQSHAKR